MRAISALLEVVDLHTHFFTRRGVAKALNGVSFSVAPGEVLGLVGETGCGKSLTVRSILSRVPPGGKVVRGKAPFQGEDLLTKSEKELRWIRGRDISVIVQNPRASLNPLLRVKELIADVYQTHTGVSRKQALQRALEMLHMVQIPDPERLADAYPHQLSGGMAQRVMIAMALSCSPKLLIADEATTGLDVTVQSHILDLIKRLIRETGSSAIVITHDLGIVVHYAQRVAVMYAGQIVESGTVSQIFSEAFHPYTKVLLAAIPTRKGTTGTAESQSVPPNLFALPRGCYFQSRCPLVHEPCLREEPPPFEMGPGHFARCHLALRSTP